MSPAWRGGVLLLGLWACGAPTDPGPEGPSGAAPPRERRLSATFGDEPFEATLVTVDRSGGTLFVSGSDGAERAIWFTMPDAGAGEYRIQPGVPIAAGVRAGPRTYVASQTAGSGTIVITSITAQRVTGEFAFTLVGDGLELTVHAGRFTVQF